MDRKVNPEAEAHAYLMRELLKTQAWDTLKHYADLLADDWIRRLTDPAQEANYIRVTQGILQGIKQVLDLPQAIIDQATGGRPQESPFAGLKKPLVLQ